MKLNNSFIKRNIAVLLSLMLFCVSAFVVNADEPVGEKSVGGFTAVSADRIENEYYSLSANAKTGNITLTDKRTGALWYSNPVDGDAQTNMPGINKMQMKSQLFVNYLIDGKTQKTATSFASSSNKDGVTVTADNSGLRVTYKFVSEEFTIPVLYTLDEYGLIASVLNSEIEENETNKIIDISLLPYFGAAGVSDSGYFLVPDGSGALINFNNSKSSVSYQQEIYDTDGLMNKDASIITVQTARLPVFGIEKNGNTLLADITSGASAAKLYSSVSATNMPYNYIYPQFTYRQMAVSKMLSKTWYPIKITFVSPLTFKENFSVRYSPIVKNAGGYSDMASLYREILVKEKGITAKTQADTVPLYLDLYGNAKIKDNILGFPVTVNKALTSFEEAQEILTKLTNNQVDSIKVRYLGINSSGITNVKTPTSFKPTRGMGGKKGFSDLTDFAGNNNIEIYPDNDFLFFKKAPFSVLKQLDATKDVCNKIGKFYEYNISNGAKESTDRYVLTPDKVRRAAEKYLKSYQKTGNKYISMSTLGSFIYSDFSDDVCLSCDTIDIFTDIMKKYASEEYSLMLESPNDYALQYTDSIVSAPISSSRFDIEDETVPFYQMVMHGLISYSVPAVNLSDSNTAVLKAIETGSSLMYALCAADYSVLVNDNYDELYSITAENWIDEIYENYKEVKNVLAAVSGKTIVLHEKLQTEVYRTVYEDGTQIFVNYNETSVEIGGNKIDGLSYKIVKAGGR